MTIAGAASLAAFFAVGQPWGTINDASAIALAASTVPIAVGLARRNPRSVALTIGVGFNVIGACHDIGVYGVAHRPTDDVR